MSANYNRRRNYSKDTVRFYRLDMHPFGHCERIGGLRQRQDYIGIEGHQGLLMA